MMNKKKVLTSLVLGTAMVSQVAVPVFAKVQTNTTPNESTAPPDEWKADSHTTIGISEVSADDADGLDPTNVSFEVPLYVTTAAVGGGAKLKTPTEYDITNNSKKRGIVVTAMQIEKLQNGTWDTVTDTANIGEKEVKLAIGGRIMPTTKAVTGKVDVPILVQGNNSAFNSDEKYVVIKKDGGTLAKAPGNKGKNTTYNEVGGQIVGLNIDGDIKNTTRTTGKAAAQFKVTYTVSAITKTADDKDENTVDKNGVVGFTYVGDDKEKAQLK